MRTAFWENCIVLTYKLENESIEYDLDNKTADNFFLESPFPLIKIGQVALIEAN